MRRVKRSLCILLILCMLVGLMPVAAFAANDNMPFTDVKESDWFYESVKYVYDNQLMLGTGETTFSPAATITRGMIVTILHRMEGKPTATAAGFPDVAAGRYCTGAVLWASANGIVKGYENGNFGPDDAITREQLAAILYRYMQYKGYDVSADGAISGFADASDVSAYAVEALNWAVGAGVVKGTKDNTLAPKGNATRAEAATMLMRFCENVVPETYTVTFDYNYDGKTAVVSVLEGKTVEEPAAPERADFTFGGWYTDADGKTAYDFDTAITGDVTLYAKWTANEPVVTPEPSVEPSPEPSVEPTPEVPKTYTVNFDYNYDEKGTYKEAAVEEGAAVGQPDAPSRSNYVFLGWTTDKLGLNSFDFSTPVTSDMTLYAQWKANSSSTTVPTVRRYTVTFESNGGNEVESQSVKRGDPAVVPEAPTKDNYIFTGWYADSELTTPYDFSSAVRKNITLYAKWEEASGTSDGLITGSGSSVDVFFISELKIDENTKTAVATVSAPENCALVVRFIEEEVYFSEDYPANKAYISESSLYASHVIKAGTDMGEIIAEITGDLPEHYVAEAILMDGNGISLCDPFSSIEHTQRYEQFKAKTVYDFDEDDTVLQFRQEIDNNFGVLADDVKIVRVQNIEIDETYKIYYLTGVTETINVGDKLFIDDGTNQVLVKAKEVSDTSGVIRVMAASADDETYGFYLYDFYKFIKVDMDCNLDITTSDPESDEHDVAPVADEFDDAAVADGYDDAAVADGYDDAAVADGYDDAAVADGYDDAIMTDEYAVAPMSVEVLDVDVSGGVTLDIPFSFETTHFNFEVKTGGTINASLVIQYDVVLFGRDYMRCDFTYYTNTHSSFKAVGKWGTENDEELQEKLKNLKEEKEIKLRKLRIPFGVTGLDAFVTPDLKFEWKITAGIEVSGESKTTSGFKYNTKDGKQKISKKEFTFSVDAKGNAEVKFGPKPSVGIEFLDGVISCGLECFMGGKAEAEAVVPMIQVGDSKHACNLCIDGNIKGVLSVDAKMKYKITDKFKGTPIDLNIVKIEWPIFDFYCSLINPSDSLYKGEVKFGKGECKNKSYFTNFSVFDENDDPCDSIVTITAKSDNTLIATCGSGYSIYLYDGNYIASAQIGSNTVSRSFTVSGEAQTIKLTKSTCDGSVSGVVKDAASKTGIENATISISRNGIEAASAKTSSDGSYNISLAGGSYKYTVSADNYVSVSGYISINDGETKYLDQTLMAKDNDDSIMGGIYGIIKDAHTGLPLSGVKVSIYCGANNTTGTSRATDIVNTTNSNGEYSYKSWSLFGVTFGLPAGNYTAVLSKDGYVTTSFNLVVIAGQDTEFNSSISPVTSENEYRVVLTWGANPSDLDSHYIAVITNGNTDHVYFRSTEGASANLDTDDTSSYGPETITVTAFGSLKNGFSYSVHDYSNRYSDNSTALSESGAIVQLYKGDNLLRSYNVPASKTGTVWNVFTVDKNGNITDVNTFENISDPSAVGSIDSSIATISDLPVVDDQELSVA